MDILTVQLKPRIMSALLLNRVVTFLYYQLLQNKSFKLEQIFSLFQMRFGIIANTTTNHSTSNQDDVSNNRQPYGLQQ